MSRDDVVRFLAERRQHWRARNPAGLAAGHVDEGLIQSPIFGSIRGREAIEASYRELFKVFADWTMEEDTDVIDGHRVVQLFSAQGTHTSNLFGMQATGRRFEIHGTLVLDLKDEKGLKIERERRFYDFTSMLLQLGLLKAKPG